jgi:hypothetical protein
MPMLGTSISWLSREELQHIQAIMDPAVLADVNYESAARLDELQKAARVHNIEFSIHRVARGEELQQLSTVRRHRAPQR